VTWNDELVAASRT